MDSTPGMFVVRGDSPCRARGPVGGRFLLPDLDGIRRIHTRHPFLKRMTVPANSYPGQTAELHSMGL
jgi:hypothetical protein